MGKQFTAAEQNRIVVAWEDRTPFEAIATSINLAEADVIKLMRTHLKPSAFAAGAKSAVAKQNAGLRSGVIRHQTSTHNKRTADSAETVYDSCCWSCRSTWFPCCP